MDADFAEICGIHAGDGYLRNDGHRRDFEVSGNFQEKEYYNNHVVPLFSNYFNIKITPRYFLTKHTYGFVIRNKKVIEEMHKIGFPYGAKSKIVKAPEEIKFGDKKNMQRFLRGLFDTDGCLTFRKNNQNLIYHSYPSICWSSVSKELSNGVKILLNNLNLKYVSDINISKNQKWSKKYRVWLHGISNLEKWMEKIEPKNNTKNLKYYIWKEHNFCPPNLTL